MKRAALFILFFCSLISFASDVKVVSITYTYISDDANESPRQAKCTAFERARSKALEDNFGTDVSCISKVIQRSVGYMDSLSSSNDVFALHETSVRGEWIETIEEKVIDQSYTNGIWKVQVYVKGRARSKTAEKAQVKFTLNNKYQNENHIDRFADGDNLFLNFSSPVNGVLCVYLVDDNNDVFCLLPYSSTQIGYQAIEANRRYVLFSHLTDSHADEYRLHTKKRQEQNVLYVIFSPNIFIKANDSDENTKWWEEQHPRQLSYSSFINWLSKNQAIDEDMVVRTEVITIVK